MRVGLIGCGALGSAIARAILDGETPGIRLIGISDCVETPAALETAREAGCPLHAEVRALIDMSPELVVEAASQAAVRTHAASVLEAGIDLMVISVGALCDPDLNSRLCRLAAERNCRIFVPSGAIGGIDIIRAAGIAGLDECRLTSTKPVRALAGIPYLEQKGMDLDAISEPTVVYEGTASEAVRLFPQSVNVAATLSLAGIGFGRTVVRIVADPQAGRNTHEIFLRGAFGEATIRLANLPSPENPKSSYLTSLSVIAALRGLGQRLKLGT